MSHWNAKQDKHSSFTNTSGYKLLWWGDPIRCKAWPVKLTSGFLSRVDRWPISMLLVVWPHTNSAEKISSNWGKNSWATKTQFTSNGQNGSLVHLWSIVGYCFFSVLCKQPNTKKQYYKFIRCFVANVSFSTVLHFQSPHFSKILRIKIVNDISLSIPDF